MVFLTTQGEYFRDWIEKGVVEVPVQVADVLTKPLSKDEVWVTSETSLVWYLARGSDQEDH